MEAVTLIVFALVLSIAALVFLFRPYGYGNSIQRVARIGDYQSDPSADTEWRSARIRSGLSSCKQAQNRP